MAALNIFTVPAVAIGRLVDGVKKTTRKVLLLTNFSTLFIICQARTLHTHTQHYTHNTTHTHTFRRMHAQK